MVGLKVAAILALLTAAGWIGPNAWIAHSARPFAYASAAAVPARTFAIVPGSRVSHDQPLPILRDRLQAAIDLYRAGRVKAILVSGQENTGAPEATVMRTWLRAHGVPSTDVWSDGGGTRTRETMNRAAAFYGVTDAVVCTQTVNMARSLYLARQAGIDAVGLALPTRLGESTRYLATESLKTTLAFAESQLLPHPAPAAPIVAVR
ncbi:MAG TPA: YdcF family protein [Polyangia bacterium]|jgi:SanA protein|nr:YdcF family protein [Polyangia bacterium]